MAAQVQNAIPEAIAFVVSNRDGTEPIFRITPEGMLMRMVIEQPAKRSRINSESTDETKLKQKRGCPPNLTLNLGRT